MEQVIEILTCSYTPISEVVFSVMNNSIHRLLFKHSHHTELLMELRSRTIVGKGAVGIINEGKILIL